MSVFITVLACILVFGGTIFIHEFGHFVTAKMCGVQVNEFSIGMGPALFHVDRGETRYAVRLLPIGGFVQMEGEDEDSDNERSFTKAPVWKRILIVCAGVFNNVVLCFLLLIVLVCQQSAITSKTVSVFDDNAVSQSTGLCVGDEIIAVNGRKCYIADDIVYEFERAENYTADLTVRRDGETVELPGVRFASRTYDDGSTGMVIDFKVLPIEKNFGTITKEAALWTASLGREIFLNIVDMITGREAINNLSGPVGIVTVISEAVSYGWKTVVLIMAMISVNLGVFNLLPLPALDGGKLFLLIIEGVTRRKIPEKYEAAINIAGFFLIIGLMIFVTFNDVSRLIG